MSGRIGAHTARASGDTRAQTAVQRIEIWIRGATGGDPAAIKSGYHLDGTMSSGADYLSMAFVAPLGVGAMVGLERSILPAMAEQEFRRAMTISNGDLMIFLTKPISLTLLVLALIAIIGPRLWALRGKPLAA